ncbi:hypothetical protein J6590_013392 [Homalodisca vitripennis]|nr:hypothetical protein J6590_013392 [Homalodisca vitripennis]
MDKIIRISFICALFKPTQVPREGNIKTPPHHIKQASVYLYLDTSRGVAMVGNSAEGDERECTELKARMAQLCLCFTRGIKRGESSENRSITDRQSVQSKHDKKVVPSKKQNRRSVFTQPRRMKGQSVGGTGSGGVGWVEGRVDVEEWARGDNHFVRLTRSKRAGAGWEG